MLVLWTECLQRTCRLQDYRLTELLMFTPHRQRQYDAQSDGRDRKTCQGRSSAETSAPLRLSGTPSRCGLMGGASSARASPCAYSRCPCTINHIRKKASFRIGPKTSLPTNTYYSVLYTESTRSTRQPRQRTKTQEPGNHH